MIAITKYPKATVDVGAISLWCAVHNVVYLEMQREDLSITSVVNSGGFAKINLVAGHGVVTGEKFYFRSGVYDTIATATTAGATTILTDVIFQVGSSGGFLNRSAAVKNYRVETRIIGINSFNQYYVIATSTNYPDYRGVVRVYLEPYLRRLLQRFSNDFAYNAINWADPYLSAPYNFSYREVYEGSSTTFSTILPANKSYVAKAAKQIQTKYGANLGQYVPFPLALAEEKKAKFLSEFEVPTYFVGFPFDLSFIYSSEISPYQITREEDELSVNEAITTHNSDVLSSIHGRAVNRLMLSQNYATTVPQLDVWLEFGIEPPDDAILEVGVLDVGVVASRGVDEPFNPYE